jgi:hypothetical protein
MKVWLMAIVVFVGCSEIPIPVDSFHTVSVSSWKNVLLWMATKKGPQTNSKWESRDADLVIDDDDDDDADDDWIPDRHKQRPSPYTMEEEEVIAAMGGKEKQKTTHRRRRQEGYLGDSTLEEICTDYSVPMCYIADVLCSWEVPIPINPQSLLGDLVTGEQAFAILEAVNSLDVAALHDRYSDFTLEAICYEWDINLSDAFAMAMKEGWNLPFGVQTFLRTDQERELLRVLVDPEATKIEPSRNADDETYY